MKSLLGIILRSKCKFRKGVKALRKLLPTWLALMNSSRRFRQIPKWRIASIWLRWLITLLNVFLFFFFFTPPTTSSNHRRCVQNPWCCLSESVSCIQVWQLAQAWGKHIIRTDVVKPNPCTKPRQVCTVYRNWRLLKLIWTSSKLCKIRQTLLY